MTSAAVAADGTLVIDERFLDRLTDAQLAAVLAHEVLHLSLSHHQRLRDHEPKLWGLCADCAVNLLLDQLSAEPSVLDLPPDGILEPAFRGRSAEEIYRQGICLPGV